ncbi:hypothetical protein PVL29_022943 [Vitis rotundifolia]|uniref:Disease resistance protein n=1 Tax=Vitis rotundifolia TaxID=103349 RepID=A0AA39DC02_VITRO|nr:hypothetical protein PVL29_022943 [Vitis rotundifolia]
MADTVSIFVEKLSNLVLQEAFLFGQVEGQVKLLRDELKWMRLFLKDADSQTFYNEKIKLWVEHIRNVTHDVEDVIDEFILDMDRRQLRVNTLKFLKCLPTYLSSTSSTRIMANRSKYGLEALMDSSSSSTTDQVVAHKEKWAQVVEGSDVVEIEDDTEVVTQMLMKGEMRRAVVSIMGMGGLGKTTLAKKVYNHNDAKQHFDRHAWVYVSQEFKAREIFLGIAYCVMSLSDDEKKKEVKEMGEAELGRNVREYLKEKYLVAMDDGWSREVWSSLRSYLPEAKDGSKEEIAWTSLNSEEEIAQHANSQALIYRLRIMNADESWQLLLKKNFGNRSAFFQSLPLAIVVVGGLLSTKEKTRSSWEKVLASIDWHLSQGPESRMGILALSYNDLPYYLKYCFLYCGIFPEDSEIKTSKRGKEPLEDIAEAYLYELIHRSMIQVAAREIDGRVTSCRIHDLLRDLAISEARDARLFEVHENIVVAFPTSNQFQTGSKLLTVLDLGSTNDNFIVPEEIGELVHLKFLHIRASKRVTLPSSIDRLVNLQSFDLGYNDSYVPHTIWKLQQLRHLNCSCGEISSQFKLSKCVNGYLGVEKLTNLQTLDLLPGSWLEGDGLGKLAQLKKLNLGGWLNPHLKKGFFECIANLTALQTLNLLKRWKNVIEEKTLIPGLMSFSHHTYLYEVILEGKLELPEQIEFYPPNLLELRLDECKIKKDPMLILEKLPNLRVLILSYNSYLGKNLVCFSRGFLRLQSLELDGLHFLEELRIWSCPKLEKLPHGLLQLKNLEKVESIWMYDQLMKEAEETKVED